MPECQVIRPSLKRTIIVTGDNTDQVVPSDNHCNNKLARFADIVIQCAQSDSNTADIGKPIRLSAFKRPNSVTHSSDYSPNRCSSHGSSASGGTSVGEEESAPGVVPDTHSRHPSTSPASLIVCDDEVALDMSVIKSTSAPPTTTSPLTPVSPTHHASIGIPAAINISPYSGGVDPPNNHHFPSMVCRTVHLTSVPQSLFQPSTLQRTPPNTTTISHHDIPNMATVFSTATGAPTSLFNHVGLPPHISSPLSQNPTLYSEPHSPTSSEDSSTSPMDHLGPGNSSPSRMTTTQYGHPSSPDTAPMSPTMMSQHMLSGGSGGASSMISRSSATSTGGGGIGGSAGGGCSSPGGRSSIVSSTPGSPHCYSLHGHKKKAPQPIPKECKDEAYWERRKRNNESAKRSRELRRIKEQQTTLRVFYLEQENLQLRTELGMLRSEVDKLRSLLYNNNAQQPQLGGVQSQNATSPNGGVLCPNAHRSES